MRAIFPVLVGEVEPGTSQRTRFSETDGLPNGEEGAVVASVDEVARGQLARRYGPRNAEFRLAERAPGAVLARLLQHYGGDVDGSVLDDALDAVSQAICTTVMDVAAGKMIAQAASLDDMWSHRRAKSAKSAASSSGQLPLPSSGLAPTQTDSWRWLQRLLCLRGARQTGPVMGQRHVPDSSSEVGPSVATHGNPSPGGVAGYFSSIVHEAEEEKVVNPLLVHKAKETREAELKTKSKLTGGTSAGGK